MSNQPGDVVERLHPDPPTDTHTHTHTQAEPWPVGVEGCDWPGLTCSVRPVVGGPS